MRGRFDLNLSTRPFPAYRLINIALISVLVVLAVISVWQAIGFVRFSNMARDIRPSEQEARVEAESLRERVAELESRLDRPEATAKLNEIGFLNNLIARKNFSWTRLLALLEDLVPDSVRLVALTPSIDRDGNIMLNISLRGRSIADVTEFIEGLEKSAPVFERINVSAEQRQDADVDITLTTHYFPQRDTR